MEKQSKKRSNWYRLPKKQEARKPDPSIRRRTKAEGVDVVHLRKSAYEGTPNKGKESADAMILRLNSAFNLKLSDDVDSLISDIFKRGWKVSTVELGRGKNHVIRFFRDVGDNRSRTFVEKSDSFKKLMLMALEVILSYEDSRHKNRIGRSRRRESSSRTSNNDQ